MAKIITQKKNYLTCNDLIIKSMYKRRRLVFSAISKICDNQPIVKVVK